MEKYKIESTKLIVDEVKEDRFYKIYVFICETLGLQVVSKEDFIKCCNKQQIKGLEKYGRTIDDCPLETYDWSEMALEEIVDLFVYSLKNNRLKEVDWDKLKRNVNE